MEDYWNHNAAYHAEILRVAARIHGDVLDVGCGEGLLVQRLAPVSLTVTGVDLDPAAIAGAGARTTALSSVRLVRGDFLATTLAPASFDLVVFVATIHHLELRAALTRAQEVLRPGGELHVVGLYRNAHWTDWALSSAQLPLVRLMGWLRREQPDIGVVMAEPRESLAEIRAVARELLPGASIRRRLYYRYTLRWSKPALTVAPVAPE